jgi:hypothetical protein
MFVNISTIAHVALHSLYRGNLPVWQDHLLGMHRDVCQSREWFASQVASQPFVRVCQSEMEEWEDDE